MPEYSTPKQDPEDNSELIVNICISSMIIVLIVLLIFVNYQK